MPEPRRLSGMQESERAQTETARAEGGVIMAKIRMVSPYFEETYMVIESAESIKNELLIRADMRQSGAKEQWNTLACVF